MAASNVPPPDMGDKAGAVASKGFATDTDISGGKATGNGRELVPWAEGSSAPSGGIEEGGSKGTKDWDQFAANEKLYGVSSTYNEDLYTTRLDASAIPKEQRDKADRIAREIESGNMHSEIEGKLEGEDDEEAKFSSVPREKEKKEEQKPLSQLPQGRDLESLSSLPGGEGFARELRKKRGMISEMKRINALNLEPTIPKLDDHARRVQVKGEQLRSVSRMTAGTCDLKDRKSVV